MIPNQRHAVLTGHEADCDDVLIVRFPDAKRFLATIDSETDTRRAAPIRAEALEATVRMAMHPFRGFEAEHA